MACRFQMSPPAGCTSIQRLRQPSWVHGSASVNIDVPAPVGLGVNYQKPTAQVSIKSIPGRTIDNRMVTARDLLR